MTAISLITILVVFVAADHVWAAPAGPEMMESMTPLQRVARSHGGHPAPVAPPIIPRPRHPKKQFFIDQFEIENDSSAQTKILPIELGVGLGLGGDINTQLANGVLQGGPLPNGLLGRFNPESGVLGTLGETLVGKNPLGLGKGLNFDLDVPDLTLGLGLGNRGNNRKPSSDSLLDSIIGDDSLGSLIGSLLKLE